MAKKRKLPKFRHNPYLLLTGAVAASATALLAQQGETQATHSPEAPYLPTIFDPAKMYSDKEPGRPCFGLAEPDLSICYMNVTVDRSLGAEATAYDWGILGGLPRWSNTPSTLYYQLFTGYDWVRDIHIKTADLPPTVGVATVSFYDYHNEECILGDCSDDDQIASHQPQRWWTTIIRLDSAGSTRFLDEAADIQPTIIAHEVGHTLGLNDIYGCGIVTLMDVDCAYGPPYVRDPQSRDICSINHGGWPVLPLMYGDAWDPNHPQPSDPLHLWAYRKSATEFC